MITQTSQFIRLICWDNAKTMSLYYLYWRKMSTKHFRTDPITSMTQNFILFILEKNAQTHQGWTNYIDGTYCTRAMKQCNLYLTSNLHYCMKCVKCVIYTFYNFFISDLRVDKNNLNKKNGYASLLQNDTSSNLICLWNKSSISTVTSW